MDILEQIKKHFGEIEVLDTYIDDKTASKNFKDSLAIGRDSEEGVLGKIQKKYPKAHLIEGYCKECDIYVPETDKKVEVKQDKKSNFTGNIVVEIEFDGKPSALSTTESDYWVFDDGEIYIWITPDILRQVIKPFSPVRFVGNGDNKPKLAYLIKKQIIIDNALKVDKY